MEASLVQVPRCSTCGRAMTAKGECLSCLLHLGFDESSEPVASPIFGDYEIARREDGSFWELGHGAMGVTYRAEDKTLNRFVALKVVEAPGGGNGGQLVRDRFLREARAAAAFRHPNVAAVFHFGASSVGDRCYYAMELVEGETLEALVRREGPLKVEAALEVAVQVTRALIAAAEHGLIHRDLKPGNIMLTATGAGPAELDVKVIDFGLAKATAGNGNQMDLTHGAFLGTPAFASPEQFRGVPADARSDIYSLGATVWYALTGEVPSEGTTIDEIRRCQSELPLPLKKLAARKIPKPVIQLLGRILAVDPAQRPASARELMESLELCRAQISSARSSGWNNWSAHRKVAAVAIVAALSAAVFFALQLSRPNAPATVFPPSKSIAVLPFQNLSDDKANAYFADGVQDEVLTILAKVADLKVISRTSVMQFRDTEKRNLRDIAQQLGVAHVLEGSVQRANNHVRVTAQLIDARTDSHLWADQYDGELADVFSIQSQIAQKIAAQLKPVLSPNERAALEARPTKDTAAYELYLQAKELSLTAVRNQNTLREPIKLLDEAVARDPTFVPALCLLVRTNLELYWFGFDRSPARRERAQKALEAAARLQPDAGEVHFARALFYYWGSRDYAPALAELALARRALPNDADVVYFIGGIERREGRWADATRHFEEGVSMDPRNPITRVRLGINYTMQRRYGDAARTFDALRAWKPNEWVYERFRASVDIQARGDLRRTQSSLTSPAAKYAAPNVLARVRLEIALAQRDYRAAEEALSVASLEDNNITGDVMPREWMVGVIATGLGETDKARAAFLAARERATADLDARPEDAIARMFLARIEARLGNKDTAIRMGEEALAQQPPEKDAVGGARLVSELALIYAEEGEPSRALDLLEQAAKLPAGPHYGRLKLDEAWDILRNEPRFQKILASLAPKPGN